VAEDSMALQETQQVRWFGGWYRRLSYIPYRQEEEEEEKNRSCVGLHTKLKILHRTR